MKNVIFVNKLLILSIIFTFFLFLFISCSKKEEPQGVKNNNKKESVSQENSQDNSDTAMTPEEKFSSSITLDFLDTPEDEDLTDYLENQLFKYSQSYRGASIMQLTNTIWFVTLENKNLTKNFLLQKFVDFNSNDYYFVLKETNLTTADVITGASLYRNSTMINNKDTQTQSDQPQK